MSKDRFFYLVEGLHVSTRMRIQDTVARLKRRGLLEDPNWEGYFYAILEGEVMFDTLSSILTEEAVWKAYSIRMVKETKILIS